MNTAWSVPIISPGLPPQTVCLPGDAFETSTVNFEPLRERRREARYPTHEEVRVTLLDASGLVLSGVLRDVSRSGFRVELPLPVTIGARVKVSIPGKVVIFANARYCRAERDGFQVGASIDAMFCPSALLADRAAATHAAPNLAAGDAGESACQCRDLARAIIQHQKLFSGGVLRPETSSIESPANGPTLPDRLV